LAAFSEVVDLLEVALDREGRRTGARGLVRHLGIARDALAGVDHALDRAELRVIPGESPVDDRQRDVAIESNRESGGRGLETGSLVRRLERRVRRDASW
jgi:hypothetical protein